MNLDALIAQITDEVCRRYEMQSPQKYNGSLAAKLEYTLIEPSLSIKDIEQMCETAKAKRLACVCVAQWFVDFAKQKLKDCDVKVSTCIGLPGGNSATAAKYAEVKEAVKNGVDEVDIPINMQHAVNGNYEELKNDLEEAMVPAKNEAVVKAVLELGQLSADQLKNVVKVCIQCGVDYISVSNITTGSPHDLAQVKQISDMCKNIKVKALGKINSAVVADELLSVGVRRIGTSTAETM